jgi:hypothetical protein
MRAVASGRSQGGFSSTIYVHAEGKGKPRATLREIARKPQML